MNYGSITDSYATGYVNGDRMVGGLTGYNRGTVENSYSVGRVINLQTPIRSGGLVGMNEGGTVSNSYYNGETAFKYDSGKGDRKTTSEMKTESTFTDAGWDFTTIWNIDGTANDGYPFLR